jgi:acetyl esterase/lipase
MSALAVTDPSRIGLMGHSMGGAASVELGRQRRDISAVIDIMAGSADVSSATADINGDGTVDVADIAAIITRMTELARRHK